MSQIHRTQSKSRVPKYIRWKMSHYVNDRKYVHPSYVRAPGPAKLAIRRHHPFELVAGKSVRPKSLSSDESHVKHSHHTSHHATHHTGHLNIDKITSKHGGDTPRRLNRNNTDFPLKLFEYFRGLQFPTEYGFLKYYQNITREYTKLSTDARGLLIYYTMGMGKSILAVTLAIEQIKIKPVVMILAKALQDNMRGAIHKYVKMRTAHEPNFYLGMLSADDLNAWIDRNFSFVSLNASNMAKQVAAISSDPVAEFDAVLEKRFGEIVKIGNLDGKTIIVDEAHNLMRMITNGSQNGIKLYDMIMAARGASVYFLSGTPISNNPFELVPCMNMIAGRVVLPTDYAEFTRAFVSPDGYIANKGKFMNRIFGLVSHVSHWDTPGAALFADPAYAATHTLSGATAEFPEQKPIIVERVPMTTTQYTAYQLARDKEADEGKSSGGKKGTARAPPALTKPKSGASSSYRVRSRQLSNWAPATSNVAVNATNPADERHDSSMYSGESGKYPRVLANLDKHKGQTGILYSQFVSNGGLGSLAKFLESNGWEEVKITSASKNITPPTMNLPADSSTEPTPESSAMPDIDDIVDTGDAAVKGGADWFLDDIAGGASDDESDSSTDSESDGKLSHNSIIGLVNQASVDVDIDPSNLSKLSKLSNLSAEDKQKYDSELSKLSKLSKLSILSKLNKHSKIDHSEHVDRTQYIIRNATDADIGTLGLTSADITHPFYAVIVEESSTGISTLKPCGVFVVEYTKGTIIVDGKNTRMCAGRLVRYEADLPPCISRAVFMKLVNDTSICVKSADEFIQRTWPGQNIAAAVDVKTGAGWRVGGRDAPRRFAIISGDVPADDRTALADLFNEKGSISAELLDLLMVSSTGAEGLDLKNGRHVHVLEPYWTWNRILQVIARLVRNDAHTDLPKDQRDVTPYIYLAVPPASEPQVPTTDTELYEESLADHGMNESFHEALREASIECMVNGGKNCRQCAPTNEPLYSDDLFRDLRAVDPCAPVVSAEITAKDITVDGVLYHYLPDSDSVFGWRILRKDTAVDSWRRVPEHDADFMRVIEVISPETLGIGI